MKLRDVLNLMDEENVWENRGLEDPIDCRPLRSHVVTLAYMSEDETWVKSIPADHPILSYLYDAEVTSAHPGNEDEMIIWIDSKYWLAPSVPPCVPSSEEHDDAAKRCAYYHEGSCVGTREMDPCKGFCESWRSKDE